MCNGLLRGISREGARRSRYASRDTRGRTRTCNLLLRREAPYPLGHTSSYVSCGVASFSAAAWQPSTLGAFYFEPLAPELLRKAMAANAR